MADPHAGHADHDPLLIVAFLDGDLASPERDAGAALVASCPDCAELRDDLLALSAATRALPTPARTRDFRLTAADAARLAAAATGEPTGPTARLAGVMTDPTINAGHAGHDTLLVASLADHSLAPTERSAAEALVAACDDCAALHADLLALRDATRAMPTPPRPRDYALTPDDAARLRRGGWRRFVAAFGSPRDAFSKPLAVGLTTLGLAGLLIASAPSILPSFGSGATPVLSTVGNAVGLGAPGAEPGSSANRGAGPRAVVGRRLSSRSPLKRPPQPRQPPRRHPRAIPPPVAGCRAARSQRRAPAGGRSGDGGRHVGCRGAGTGPGHRLAHVRCEPDIGRSARRAATRRRLGCVPDRGALPVRHPLERAPPRRRLTSLATGSAGRAHGYT